MKKILSHGGTVLSVMGMIFICINFVNEAMAFYNHLYTKILLLAVCLLLVVNSLILKKTYGLHLPLLILFCLVAAGEAILCAVALWDSFTPVFTGIFGQILALCLCLFTLAVSVSLTAKEISGK